jgi:hypothetical protein
MKIFLTFLVLLFSSSVVAEFPSSLFGIKLKEPIKNYIKENEEKYVDTEYPELFSSYFDDQIKNLIKNSRFDMYDITENEIGLVDSIMGSKLHYSSEDKLRNILIDLGLFEEDSWEGIKNKYVGEFYEQDQCIEKTNELEKTLSAYYLQGNELFKQRFYKYFWNDNKKENVYGYEKKLISKMHNIYEFDHLIIFCEYWGGESIFGLVLRTGKKTVQFNEVLGIQYINDDEFFNGLMLLGDLSGF